MKILNPAFVGFFKFGLEILAGFGAFSILIEGFFNPAVVGDIAHTFQICRDFAADSVKADGVFYFELKNFSNKLQPKML